MSEQPLWYNKFSGQWEPRTKIDSNEFWTKHVNYQKSPYQRWRENMVYKDAAMMDRIEQELDNMPRYPDAEKIWSRIKNQ